MPRVHGVRERFDQIVCETVVIEPGQKIVIEKINGSRDDYLIAGIALRLLDTKPEDEMLYLDYFDVSIHFTSQNKRFGPWPGTVLSTFRQIYEPMVIKEKENDSGRWAETQHPYRLAGRRASGKELDRMAWSTMPGYVFLRPFATRTRDGIDYEIKAHAALPRTFSVRLLVFGLRTCDV